MQRSIQAPRHARPLRTGAIRRLTALVLGIALLVLGVGSAWAMAASPAAPGFAAAEPALHQTHGWRRWHSRTAHRATPSSRRHDRL